MKIQPIDNTNFGNKIYKFTKYTSSGKRIHGQSRGYDYDVYVGLKDKTENIEYKLYCVFKNNKWVKSILKYFSNNKLNKELRSSVNDSGKH